jgi:hypothetical protein
MQAVAMAIMTSGCDEVDDPFQTPTRRPSDTFPHRYGRRSEKKWLTSNENDVLCRIEIDFSGQRRMTDGR